jgi:hypothetical protein
MLSNEGDFSKLGEGIKKSCIKCFVKETYPKFLISDGSYFISAYFTKEAFEKYQLSQSKDKNVPAINITDL